MNENDEYSHVQRRLCAVIAKSEWTSSRMRMQKSGEELRERRAKSHRTANQFLQELLEKRTDSDLIDDNGAVDRYHNFVKFKSAFHDDTNTTLDEFDRRLRDLNSNRPTSGRQLTEQYFNPIPQQKPQPVKYNRRSSVEVHNDENDDEQVRANAAHIRRQRHFKFETMQMRPYSRHNLAERLQSTVLRESNRVKIGLDLHYRACRLTAAMTCE